LTTKWQTDCAITYYIESNQASLPGISYIHLESVEDAWPLKRQENVVPDEKKSNKLLLKLADRPRAALAQLPTPIHELKNFGKQLDGQELWIKRDDLTGLEGGGNKTRKLEFLVGDAIANGADMLVTAGAIQSNHTRQTAAAAAKCNLKCALLHFGWTQHDGTRHVPG